MKRRHITALGAAAAIATTGAVVLPGIAAEAAPTKGKIHFLLAETTQNGKDSGTAVVTGAINSGGRDVSPDNADYDVLHLQGGTFRVVHPDKDAKVSFKTNKKTCIYSFAVKGRYTLAKGTGKYKGISGSGTYSLQAEGVASRVKGTCDFENNPPVAGAGYGTGGGAINLP